jgi:hypothetical protein
VTTASGCEVMPRSMLASIRLSTLKDLPLIRIRITIDTSGIYP